MTDTTAPTLAVTLVGGPTAVLEYGGLRFLTDPTLSPPGTYAGLVKTAGPALDAAAIGSIDAVLVSHDQHADNLDPGGRELLPAAAVVLTTVAAAERLGLGFERREPGDIDAGDAADRDEDHHDGAAGAAPRDRSGPAEVDLELRDVRARTAAGAGGRGGGQLGAEHLEQEPADRVAVETGGGRSAHVGPNRSVRIRPGSCPSSTRADAATSTNAVGPQT
jgi:L-ascorbate metabolism protein UlaG (beta-lactamase superfamily)